MVKFPPTSYVEILTFMCGTFGRSLSHEGRAFMNGISALVRKMPELPPMWDTMRTRPSANQEAGFHQTPDPLAP